MWVIVAVSLALSGDSPKLKIIPGSEYKTEAECMKAVHFRANVDSDGGGLDFALCMPKDQVQIGREDSDKTAEKGGEQAH
jgi:hypothetical protein